MNQNIKAIETRYKGYRFRSRLEARWAVFFDAMGIPYQYEPEGYVLKDGTHYLTDFFLPNVRGGLWVEIKPDGKVEPEAGRRMELLVESTRFDGTVISGEPMNNINDDGRFNWWFYCMHDDSGSVWSDGPYRFCVCPWCSKIGFEFDGRGARVCGWPKHHDSEAAALAVVQSMGHWRADDKCYTFEDPRIVAAANKARSARFEHGECPA